MKTKKWVSSGILTAALVFAGVAIAQRPGVDIGSRHTNLAEAQQHIQQAYDKIEEAQKDNRDQLGGHAAKAEQLLVESSRELKAAADYADHHH